MEGMTELESQCFAAPNVIIQATSLDETRRWKADVFLQWRDSVVTVQIYWSTYRNIEKQSDIVVLNPHTKYYCPEQWTWI